MSHQKVTEELARGEHISITNFVDCLLSEADSVGASDIHIDPKIHSVRIRFRIDGMLRDAHHPPISILPEIVSRIKVLSRLRTDEHFASQDGRFRYTTIDSGSIVDMRVSIIPTFHGESVVLRLLRNTLEHQSLDLMGFGSGDIAKITTALQKTSGMILATGPTGSGKTSTLYTLIKMLCSDEISIVTIEDPIEYAMDGVKQIQVQPRTGLTFASGLRSVLRQDPNIIMVGEIRDNETAHIAVNTALTGHLLLSTLHTNNAATTLPRLHDMGIEPFLIASTVSLVIGQRLLRKVCPSCRLELGFKERQDNFLIQKYLDKDSGQALYSRGKGCELCNHSGFLGRFSIHEVLCASESIRSAISRKAPASELHQIACDEGMTTMFQDGISKVLRGVTTIEEVYRVTHE